MIGYLDLRKESGRRAWIRIDEIAAFTENETKEGAVMVPCITIFLRNNVAWHFPGLTGAKLISMLKSTCGDQINVLVEEAHVE